MIYTSYFGALKRIPPDIVPISICGKAPEWWTGKQYKKLAPKWSFFQEWKQNHDNDYYTECFKEQVLDKLDPTQVVADLEALAEGRQFILLCYEKPLEFCHRHLVADWFNEHGYDAAELHIIYG